MPWELDSPAAADSAALDGRYRRFAEQRLVPLWAEVADLMPATLEPAALLHRWRWAELLPAALAGELVPVGRGGERRAIAPANPGLGGRPLATPTIWAANQYVNPREGTPTHRHSQHAFRFVAEGRG
jgi:gentisate 1,2-dioxygenase